MTSVARGDVGQGAVRDVVGTGDHLTVLSPSQVRAMVRAHARKLNMRGGRLLVIIPDDTRTAPLPMLIDAVRSAFAPDVAELNILIALGTHPPMSEAGIDRLVGSTASERAPIRVANHLWAEPDTFATLGVISAEEVEELSGGRLREEVEVRINRMVVEHDHVLVCGPVFPHEVVGFSGGNKYFFPGVSGKELIDLSHWVGALVTSSEIIGTPGVTPVRALIDRAASLIPTSRSALCFVVAPGSKDLHGLYAGPVEDAWRAAAALSSQVHIQYFDRSFDTVLSMVPEMYQDLWVAAKGMYKLEPVVADGGELILFAPHVTMLSATHGSEIREVGYHCRDYFLANWATVQHVPRGVLAHSTHLAGAGTVDALTGTERRRIRVTLATGIPEGLCREVGLGYRDPTAINVDDYAGREKEGVLLVRQAGEMLHRMRARPDARRTADGSVGPVGRAPSPQ